MKYIYICLVLFFIFSINTQSQCIEELINEAIKIHIDEYYVVDKVYYKRTKDMPIYFTCRDENNIFNFISCGDSTKLISDYEGYPVLYHLPDLYKQKDTKYFYIKILQGPIFEDNRMMITIFRCTYSLRKEEPSFVFTGRTDFYFIFDYELGRFVYDEHENIDF